MAPSGYRGLSDAEKHFSLQRSFSIIKPMTPEFDGLDVRMTKDLAEGQDVALGGRYEIDRLLDQGGMGQVCLAGDRKLDGQEPRLWLQFAVRDPMQDINACRAVSGRQVVE